MPIITKQVAELAAKKLTKRLQKLKLEWHVNHNNKNYYISAYMEDGPSSNSDEYHYFITMLAAESFISCDKFHIMTHKHEKREKILCVNLFDTKEILYTLFSSHLSNSQPLIRKNSKKPETYKQSLDRIQSQHSQESMCLEQQCYSSIPHTEPTNCLLLELPIELMTYVIKVLEPRDLVLLLQLSRISYRYFNQDIFWQTAIKNSQYPDSYSKENLKYNSRYETKKFIRELTWPTALSSDSLRINIGELTLDDEQKRLYISYHLTHPMDHEYFPKDFFSRLLARTPYKVETILFPSISHISQCSTSQLPKACSLDSATHMECTDSLEITEFTLVITKASACNTIIDTEPLASHTVAISEHHMSSSGPSTPIIPALIDEMDSYDIDVLQTAETATQPYELFSEMDSYHIDVLQTAETATQPYECFIEDDCTTTTNGLPNTRDYIHRFQLEEIDEVLYIIQQCQIIARDDKQKAQYKKAFFHHCNNSFEPNIRRNEDGSINIHDTLSRCFMVSFGLSSQPTLHFIANNTFTISTNGSYDAKKCHHAIDIETDLLNSYCHINENQVHLVDKTQGCHIFHLLCRALQYQHTNFTSPATDINGELKPNTDIKQQILERFILLHLENLLKNINTKHCRVTQANCYYNQKNQLTASIKIQNNLFKRPKIQQIKGIKKIKTFISQNNNTLPETLKTLLTHLLPQENQNNKTNQTQSLPLETDTIPTETPSTLSKGFCSLPL